ncbi:MAG TPA: glycoside hydrolase family 3 N-terminal domain-containing protein [Bacteroidales bacterium]|jgi:beta-glucosidase-like glycosyl hydrolase/CubicO group peptidase (beta-lactamase class C family)|nr:glycoside hydrolase family 3 N-terminal domain-containing protein [Bacteroidales bacterium]HQJ82769.1 glycoside hydrolase family 3 N-terminal domain-containing protein [Bacteroidales bacterium]
MHYLKNTIPVLISCLISVSALNAGSEDPPFLKYMDHPWVDSVMKTMTPEQRTGQLIWVAAFAQGDLEHEAWLHDMVRNQGIGGLIFFRGEPVRQAEMINYYQKISKVPLMIVTDGEWGLGMRLKGIEKFPYQLTLGALENDSLIYEMGKAVAGQFKRAGVNINLAPVADINNNPGNPVINFRSFGENPERAAHKAGMYMKGLQDNGIISVAKHFPGHGDTEVDSHTDLPVINHSRERLNSVEFLPFRSLINAGISGIMSAHISLPLIDDLDNRPATVSERIITGLLKNELSFRGLVLSDAMNMKGITDFTTPGEAEVSALVSGIDVLEYVTEPEKAIAAIMDKINRKQISQGMIDEKCRKVLAAKYWAGLNSLREIDTGNVSEEIMPPADRALVRDLYASSLTLLRNENNILPVKNLDKARIAVLSIGKNTPDRFCERSGDYTSVSGFRADPADMRNADRILDTLSHYDIVLAGIYNTDQSPRAGFGIDSHLPAFLDRLVSSHKTVAVYFGNPYALNKLEALQKADGLILAYEENDYTEDLSAQLIFGGTGASGTLPVTINDRWTAGYGLKTSGSQRLQYGFPENAGLSSAILSARIDSLAETGLAAKAYPGCEVIVARKGIVVFHKTYGYQTYDKRVEMKEGDLYDLASVTKISSSLPGLMILETEGRFSTEGKLGDYIPEFRHSDKGELVMKDLLAHQAGLTPSIVPWRKTIKRDSVYKRNTIRYVPSERFPVKISDKLYINRNFRDKMFNEIKHTRLGEKKYVYSDLTFILTPEIVENLSGENWADFVTRRVYSKIGAHDIVFNPWRKYPVSRIVPTENDTFFRFQQLQGTVHDENAAMLGGVSGHAGLFATANDLLKLMELYRRMGDYGGEQLIGRDVMLKYTAVQFPENNNRRGLGFDKPLLNNSELPQKDTYPTRGASAGSFGHSGYTGTFVWVDPEKEISYVFLCNRVYPTRNNSRLYDLNIRTEILQSVYDSISGK